MKDSEFVRAKVPMTKEEIRTIILSKLELKTSDNFMDIGAGTGSVSVEVAHKLCDGNVFAVEHKPEALELINQNVLLHNVKNINIISGKAPECLDIVKVPINKFFIGGSGGNLKEILQYVDANIPIGGIAVVSAIVLETMSVAYSFFNDNDNYINEIIQVTVNRIKKVNDTEMLTGGNPVFIITSKRIKD